MIECDCDDFKLFECMDCAACTNCNHEYYMVTEEVWFEVNSEDRGMLCIGCLESRRGKLLMSGDFSEAPINSIALIVGSTRLKNRLLTH